MKKYLTEQEWLELLNVKQLENYNPENNFLKLVNQNINKELTIVEVQEILRTRGEDLKVYKNIQYNEYANEFMSQLYKGVFLTTKVANEVNTMTVSWGNIGIIWNRPTITIYVRYSRHTYDMLEAANEFTLNVPLNRDLHEELQYCGRNSGKDVNKFQDCNLHLAPSRKIDTPIISECNLHYECNILYKQAQEPGLILDEVKNKFYTNNNYHIMYIAEIVDCYIYEE